MAEHVATKTKPRTADRVSTADRNVHLAGASAASRVRDVTRADISRLHHDLRDNALCGEPGAGGPVKNVRAGGKVGRAAGRLQSMPARREVRRAKARTHACRLTSSAAWGTRSRRPTARPSSSRAIKLLIFTGARLSEVLGLRWDWIDFERGEARLPDSKTGAKTLHLPPPALGRSCRPAARRTETRTSSSATSPAPAGQPRKAVARHSQGRGSG